MRAYVTLITSLCYFIGIASPQDLDTSVCRDRCWEPFSAASICHCDYKCREYDNCCDDFIDLCLLPTGKMNVSCFARCLEPPTIKRDTDCACDSQCTANGTCCSDFTPVCASEYRCFMRCGAAKDSRLQCQCDSMCKERKDCCTDYANACDGEPLCDSCFSVHRVRLLMVFSTLLTLLA